MTIRESQLSILEGAEFEEIDPMDKRHPGLQGVFDGLTLPTTCCTYATLMAVTIVYHPESGRVWTTSGWVQIRQPGFRDVTKPMLQKIELVHTLEALKEMDRQVREPRD